MQKKFVYIVFLFSLFGCVQHNIWNPPRVEEIDPLEIIGVQGKPFVGKLYLSTCQSNAFGNTSTAKKTALKNAAEKADELGYKYFTVLDQDTRVDNKIGSYTTYDSITSHTTASVHGSGGYAYGNATTTTRVPRTNVYNYEFNTYTVVFLLLNEDELEKWNNIYSVSNYLSKE